MFHLHFVNFIFQTREKTRNKQQQQQQQQESQQWKQKSTELYIFLYIFWFVEEFIDECGCVCMCVCVTFLLVWMEILICLVGARHWWTELMTHNTAELTMIFIYCNIFSASFNSCSSFIWFLCHTHTIYVPFLIHLYSHSLCVRSYRFQILTFKINIHMQFTTKRETLFFLSSPGRVIAYVSIHATAQTVYTSATLFVHLDCGCARVCAWVCDGICVGGTA